MACYELSEKEVAALRECIDVTVRAKGVLLANTALVLMDRLNRPIPEKKETPCKKKEDTTADSKTK